MKSVFVCLLLFSPSIVIAAPYKYPEIIDVNVSCAAEKQALQKISDEYSYNEECPNSIVEISPVDLNGDGVCEYFVTTDWGRRCTPTTRLVRNEDSSKALAYFDGKAIENFAEKRNGYYRLIHYAWDGYRADPVYTVDILYFNGAEYTCEFCEGTSHGAYMDLAKNAYDKGEYELAEIYYWNAYAMGGEKKISDANNLALAYIKNKNEKKAVTLMNKYLSYNDEQLRGSEALSSEQKLRKLRASSYFNRGLAYERIGDKKKALSDYEKSLQQNNNSAVKYRIENLGVKM